MVVIENESSRLREFYLREIDDWRAGNKATLGSPATGQTYSLRMREEIKRLEGLLTTIRRNETMPTQTLPHSEPELNAAFKRVENPQDWRAPIDVTIRCKNPGEAFDLITTAVMFYTATEAVVTYLGKGMYHVKATGYRNGPAGP